MSSKQRYLSSIPSGSIVHAAVIREAGFIGSIADKTEKLHRLRSLTKDCDVMTSFNFGICAIPDRYIFWIYDLEWYDVEYLYLLFKVDGSGSVCGYHGVSEGSIS